MGRRCDYKKQTIKICHYCDYDNCRKGHKCRWYKKFVKRIKKEKVYYR